LANGRQQNLRPTVKFACKRPLFKGRSQASFSIEAQQAKLPFMSRLPIE
jgi:hypothetical protein